MESAMYVCIIMEYYKLGDMDRVLKQKRRSKEHIEELLLKKWLGQMVEALCFVHDRKVIHRDLKPSNIFMKDDLSISIGDFGVATVMGDIRTMTRTAVGTMNWMAPEILEATSPQYDERSDVWSLGCIILEMATCGFMDQAEMSTILFQLKGSPQIVEDVLENVSKHYSADLCQLIRVMLRRAFHQRPTCKDLLLYPYVQECLGLTNSPLFKGAKDSGEKSNAAKPLPTAEGVSGVLKYMKQNISVHECQTQSLQYFVEQTKNHDQALKDDVKKAVMDTMKVHMTSVEIQTLACHVLGNAAVIASEGDILFSKQFISPVCLAMRSHAGSPELQCAATAFLMTLSSDEEAAEVIGAEGGIQDILAAMRTFPKELELVSNCCIALWSLSVVEKNTQIITEERGLQDILIALDNHGQCKDLCEAACSALWSLSMEDQNINYMADGNAAELVLQSLKTHIMEVGVVKYAFAALSSMAESEEILAFQIANTDSGLQGIPIIMEALKKHPDNSELVENAATLLMELANYPDICAELLSQKVVETMTNLKVQHISNEDVSVALNSALVIISGGKLGQSRPISSRARAGSASVIRKH
ncbi:serine/threonine kinase-like domain-containing protein STKLD1 isoform X2 [Dysidea avara]|uniref:serine/threonine kinase-like domain-containing protein STKLD1 isoform X2 n=1 Tax=Dysidea avara TaxID=196820 RepID=UPI003331CAC9